MLTPEEKIIFLQPKLLKIIKKTLPQIRSKYVAKELMDIALKIANEIKSVKSLKLTNKEEK